MKNILFKFIILTVCITLLCTSCKNSENISNESIADNINLTSDDKYFVHSEYPMQEQINISNTYLSNDELLYTGYLGESYNTGCLSVISPNNQENHDIIIDNKNLKIKNILFSELNDNIAYIIYENETQKRSIAKYNISEKKIINDTSIDGCLMYSLIFDKDNNIIVSSTSQDNKTIILKYNEDLSLISQTDLSKNGITADEITLRLKKCPDNGYCALIFNQKDQSRYLIKMDNDFIKQFNIANDNIADDSCLLYDFTFTQAGNILLHFQSSENDLYMINEVSLTDGSLIEMYNLNLSNTYSAFGYYDQFDFTYISKDGGLYGYSLANNKNSLIYKYDTEYNNIKNVFYTADDKIFLMYLKPKEKENLIYSTSTEKNTIPIKISDDEYLNSFFVDPNNDIYIVSSKEDSEDIYLIKQNKNGDISYKQNICLNSESLCDTKFSSKYMATLTYNIDSESYTNVFVNVFDIKTGNKIKTVNINKYNEELSWDESSLVSINTFSIYKDYIYFKFNNTMYQIDMNNQDTISTFIQNVPDEIKFINNIDGYNFCFYNDDGIFGYNTNSSSLVKLVDWNNCDVNINKQSVEIYDENTFYVIGCLLNSSTENSIYKFTKADEKYIEQMKNKTHITIAGININENKSTNSMLNFYNTIEKINNTSSDYVVKFSNYDSSDKLKLDISSGNIPDIIFNCNDFDLNDLDIFHDLSDYINTDSEIKADQFFTNILYSGNYKDKIYNIIPEFSLLSLYGKSSVIGNTEPWSSDEFFKFADNSSSNQLFNNDPVSIFNYFITYNLNSYIDYDKKKCSINNENVIKILNIIKENSIDPSLDDNQNSYDIKDTDNMCCLNIGGISKIDEINILTEQFNGETVSYKGIPGINSAAPVIYPTYTLGITRNCKHKDQAWELIKSFLSDEYQNNTYTLPIKRTAYNNQAKKIIKNNQLIQEIEKLIDSSSKTIFTNESLSNLISDELNDFLYGSKSAEDVLKSIETKINIFLSETE